MRAGSDNSATIITYHSIDDSGSVISTAPEAFRRQMRFLRDSGFRSVTMSELADILGGDDPVPERTLAITFDDGYRNFMTEAMPVLEECGFTSTVFCVTGHCGGYNDWEGNPQDFPRSELLGWDEIRQAGGKGVEFGVHTRRHLKLAGVSKETLTDEILGSKSELEERTGRSVESFAYPFGIFDGSTKALVEQSFRSACSTVLGRVGKGSDLFALRRVDAYYLGNPKVLRSIATRSFDNYMSFRQAMRTVKSYVAGN